MANQPKKYKKFVATAATATLVASAIVPVASAAHNDTAGHQFESYINEATELGLFKDGGEFKPQNKLTRKHVVLILGRYLEEAGKKPAADYATNPAFTDLGTSDAEYIRLASVVKEAGIFSGDNGKINGSQNISRQHMAKVLNGLAEAVTGTSLVEAAKDIEDAKVTDLDAAGASYRDAIQALADFGITTVEKFNPKGDVTRGQFAKFIMETIGAVKKIEEGVKPSPEKVTEAVKAVEDAVKELPNLNDITKDNAATAKAKADAVTAAIEKAEAALEGADFLTEAAKAEIKTKLDAAKVDAKAVADKVADVTKPGASVGSATAVNGMLTVVFDSTPEGVPAVTDFKLTQVINGVTKSINASSVSYDAATKTAKLVVPTVYPTEVDQNISYTVGYKETAVKASTSFQVSKVTEAKVESITPINSKQLKVVFNQEMDKDSVEVVSKYKFVAAPQGKAISAYTVVLDATKGSTAKLQDDKKTVIITLGNTESASTGVFLANGILENKTSIGVALAAQSVKSVSGKVLEKDAMFAVKLDDTQAPNVAKVAVSEIAELEITFDEQIDVGAKVTVNGYTYTLAAGNLTHAKGVTVATIAKSDLIDPAKAGLETGKAYTIAVSEQSDVYGEQSKTVYSSSFNYSATSVAPVLKSVTAKNEKAFILEFSKPVTKVDGTALDVQVNKGAKQLVTTTATAIPGEPGKYLVELAGTDLATDVLYDRAKNETTSALTVYIPAIKDAAGNITSAGSTSVTLSKDVIKPTVEKAISTGTQLDVTLTEGIDAITSTNLAAGSYVLAENGRQIPVLAAGFGPEAASFVTGNLAAGAEGFIFDYTAGVSTQLVEGNYTLVIKKDTLTDQSLNNGNKNDEIRIPFTVGNGLQVKPEVSAVDAVTKPGEIKVTFTAPVTYASVAQYQNYKIDGQAIPSNSTFTLDSTGMILTISLPEGTFTSTKDRVVTINGARNLAGTVMAQYEVVKSVKENEQIKVQSAKVASTGDIILTFNENVDNTSLNTTAVSPAVPGVAFVAADFIVKVNGEAVGTLASVKNYDADSASTTRVAKNELRLSAPAGVSFASGTITVEIIPTATAKDAAGNKAESKIINVTR